MLAMWIWALAVAALLIVCAAEPDATTRALSTLLAALGTWPLWAVEQIKEGCRHALPRLLAAHEDELRDDAVPARADGAKPNRPAGKAEFGSSGKGERAAPVPRGWSAAILLSRLLFLAVAVAIVLGLLNLEFLRAPLVMLGIPASGDVLISPALAMGLLFTALPAFFGVLLLESLEVVPRPACLFPSLDQRPRAKRWLDWGARIGVGLSLLMEVGLFVDSWLLLQHLHSLLLEFALQVVTALAVLVAGIPIGWSLIVGTGALVALLLMGVWLVAAGLALLLRGVREVTGLLAEHVVPRVVHVLALPGTLLRRGIARLPLARLLLREPAAQVEAERPASTGGMVLPDLPADQPLPPPISLVPGGTALGIDDSGRRLLEPFLASVGPLGGKGYFDGAGYASLTRRPERSIQSLVTSLGGVDASPTPHELAMALAVVKNSQEKETLPLRLLTDKLLAVLPPKGTNDPVFVCCALAQLAQNAPTLVRLHQRLLRQATVLVAEGPSLIQPLDEATRLGLLAARQLWRDGAVLGCLLYDSRTSPLAQEIGQLRTLGALGKTLAALLLSQQFADQNEPPVAALTRLCAEMPFVTLAVGSTALVPGPMLARLDPGRWATRAAPVGRGDLEATRLRTEELLARVHSEARYQILALPADAPHGNTLALCLYPFHRADERFQAVAETLERAVGTTIPGSHSLMISGNGCWDGEAAVARYFAQIGLFRGWDLPPAWHEEPASPMSDPSPLDPAPIPPPEPVTNQLEPPLPTDCAATPRPAAGSAEDWEGQPDTPADLSDDTPPQGGTSTGVPPTTGGGAVGEDEAAHSGPIGPIGRKRGRPRGSATRRHEALPPPSSAGEGSVQE